MAIKINVCVKIFFELKNEKYYYFEGSFFKEGVFGIEESGLTDEQCEEFYKEYEKIENDRIGDYV